MTVIRRVVREGKQSTQRITKNKPSFVTGKSDSHAIQIGGNHYKDMAVEPWVAMKAWLTPEEYIGYLRGNIIKYQARANSGKEDKKIQLLKAGHYQQQLEEFLAYQEGN